MSGKIVKTGPLDTSFLLKKLVDDGVLDSAVAKRIRPNPPSVGDKTQHVLSYLVSAQLPDASRAGRLLNMDRLLEWLSGYCDQLPQRIDPLKIDVPAVTEVMSFAFAQRHRILAVEVTPQEVVIAGGEPFISAWENDLQQVVRRPIRRVLADPEAIDRFTVEFYSLAKSVRGASGNSKQSGHVNANLEQLLEISKLKDVDANDGHVVNIVDWLLQYAYDQRASDIHIEPRRDQGNVRFRIDGVLYNVYELPASVLTAVVSRLKILGRMDVAEKRRPQDGRLKTKNSAGDEIELRLSTLPTAFGEKMVMRIFDPEVLLRSFDELGLRGDDRQRWNSMIQAPHGIVLVTGPTGSGKTTTLYSSLKQIATSEVNVCTIEDPIEMVEDAFNQMQVQHNINLDFAGGVRALLRQDPDIIMIGEIRDLETAEMAIQAALTGHLVISTLHTNDAPSAVTRLLELGVPAYLIRATVLGVMAQRLVRSLCPHCKEPVALDEAAWATLIAPWKVNPPAETYHAPGCLECRNTGFYGRQGIYEILSVEGQIQAAIGDDVELENLRRMAMKKGMRTLRLSGAQKVARGETTIAEVLRVAPPVQMS
ncbi:Type II secretion system protein E [Zhongshania aliphaticivorans]|uniref:Type II secretion system protein E n=1 Tax=Zhongshania aliphaticivorans TaxID=1470434 RepID=A0A5S9Q852_9GAMM|nr:GspE/PulE family protein [Zhongshania aliphaticivorans]CAA0102529.1 Type II secretion system protein E [Zhongshania aliphaticivorans]CAA0114156.1 Type II secretion system protein E [Zhongshania aliphaticivorans]